MMTREDRTIPVPRLVPPGLADRRAALGGTDTNVAPIPNAAPVAGTLPFAPMAMPVQVLERPRGLLAAMLALIPGPARRAERGL
ncbi:hypothetical protein [Szabonella alba]|uniref:Uncharacterized protein n=1 Tax=Szabonella alba TaxID=2804194 RepID=A0A8K0VC09_9RHOB|nr:hypothetical protein [Szabonella alba]MBL4916467.1 hypothetical protein [Szabonella alba]